VAAAAEAAVAAGGQAVEGTAGQVLVGLAQVGAGIAEVKAWRTGRTGRRKMAVVEAE